MKLEWLGASSAGIGMHMRYLGVVVLLCACPSSISIVYRRLQEKKIGSTMMRSMILRYGLKTVLAILYFNFRSFSYLLVGQGRYRISLVPFFVH